MPEPAWGNRDIIIGKGDHLAPCHRQASIPRLTEPLPALKNIAQRESRGPSKPLNYGSGVITGIVVYHDHFPGPIRRKSHGGKTVQGFL